MNGGALLVCHAGADLGIGHLTRMLALAGALERTGGTEVRILVAGDAVQRPDLAGLPHRFVPLDADLLSEVDAEMSSSSGVVVLDLHPRLIPEGFTVWADASRERGRRLIGVDALLDQCASLDATWVPSVLVPQSAVADCAGEVHFGWDSLLLDPPIQAERGGDGTRVLVLSGGSDVTGQHRTLPAALDAALPSEAEVLWVQGPFAGTPAIPDPARLVWRIEVSPPGLGALMARADLVLTVFGVTLFEALQAGLPTVVFNPYADRSFPELDVVDAEGVAIVAGSPSDAVEELASLAVDSARAERIGTAAARRMAVPGAERLARLIHSLGES